MGLWAARSLTSKYGQYMDILGWCGRGEWRARGGRQWAAARRIDLDRLKKWLAGLSQGSVQWNPCIPRLTQSPGLDYF